MSIIWGDGFDHYNAIGDLENGNYVSVKTGPLLSTINPRTGEKCIRLGSSGTTGVDDIRFAYPEGSVASIGFAFASYFEFLPLAVVGVNYSISFRDITNSEQVRAQIYPSGAIRVMRSDNTVLGTSLPVVTANSYHHIEMFTTIDNTVGEFKIRVDDIEVLSLTGIDTQSTALTETSQVAFNGHRTATITGSAPLWDIDDLYIYDTNGARDNSYPVGDLQCILLDTDGDTAEADWSLSTGVTGYTLTSDFSDGTYVQSTIVGDRSDFTLEDLPPDINYIACLFLHTRVSKSDASAAEIQASVMSGANQAAGSSRTITTVPTYWHDMFDTDPATGVRWTKSGVDAANFRIDRTV